jgi:hypothetical protein
MKEILSRQILTVISSSYFSCFATRRLLVKDCRRALVDESEMIRNYKWNLARGRGSIPRLTDWLTVSRKETSASKAWPLFQSSSLFHSQLVLKQWFVETSDGIHWTWYRSIVRYIHLHRTAQHKADMSTHAAGGIWTRKLSVQVVQ